MRYLLYRVWKQMWNNRRIYWLIIFEMAVGIFVLVTCLNLTFTNREVLARYRQEMAEGMIPIQWEVGERDKEAEYENASRLVIDYDGYLQLEREYEKELNLYYTVVVLETCFFEGKQGELSTAEVWYLFMNDNMFEKCFGFARENDQAYAGRRAYKSLSKMERAEEGTVKAAMRGSNEFMARHGKIWFSKGCGVEYKEIPAGEKTEYIDRTSGITEQILVEDCVICPINFMDDFNAGEETDDVIFMVQNKNMEDQSSLLPELLNKISDMQDGRYIIYVSDEYLKMEKRAQEQDNLVRMFLAVSIVTLAIVTVSMIGILLIALQKRKKTAAVAFAFGATEVRNFLELFGEVFLLFLTGGGLGVLFSAVAASGFSGIATEIAFYPICVVYVLVFCLVTSAGCCLIALAGVKNREPIKVLKEL